jgi:hypothetical protein
MTNQAGFGRRGTNEGSPRVFRTEITQPVEVVVTRPGLKGGWKIAYWIICGLFVMGVANSIQDKMDARATASQTAATTQTAQAVKPKPAAKCGATLKEYMSLSIGISVSDAKRIIGCAGEELSRVAFGGQESVMISWPGEAGLFSNMNATFSSGRLTSKAQLGLE